MAAVVIFGGASWYMSHVSRKKPTILKSDSGHDDSAWERKKHSIEGELAIKQPHTSGQLDDAITQDPTIEAHNETPSAWDSLTGKVETARNSISSTQLSELIKSYVAPSWASVLPETLSTLQRELSMSQGSLADNIWSETYDAEINPEITRRAEVRVGLELCREERDFQSNRRRAVTKALASYLNLNEKDVHPDDVPVIAMCSSGGGLRALVAGTGSYLAAKQAGLWDCVMYTAGVSGTCWLQTLYYSSLGAQNFSQMVDHLKKRIGVHIAFPPDVMNLLTTVPTNKYLLRGLVEKLKGDPGSDFGFVDIYGLLLSSRLLVPNRKASLDDRDLKLSNQTYTVDSGANPLPIYSAVRHEIPVPENHGDNNRVEEGHDGDKMKEKAKQETWFQWFEFTPYEFSCEELGAGIPIWSLGRHFRDGLDVPLSEDRFVPELRVSTLMGIWGSAFCATLAHYYKEIRPILRGVVGFGGIDALIEGKNDDLIRVHPFDPATVPNFVLGLDDKLPPTCPKSVFKEQHIRLMDAGMSNNLPIYPLLRPGRGVDLIVAFDVSANVKEENWLSVVDGYARQRGVKGWPMGSGWPQSAPSLEDASRAIGEEERSTVDESNRKLSAAKEQNGAPENGANSRLRNYGHTVDSDLTYCNIWLGTTQERTTTDEPPPSKRLFHPPSRDTSDSDFHLMQPDAGIAVAYFPLLPNPAAPAIGPDPQPSHSKLSSEGKNSDQGPQENHPVQAHLIDPDKDDFMSTWNFVYTPEQVDAVVGLAKANFKEGEDQVKHVIRAIYERKKKARLERARQGEREGLCILS